MYDLTPIIEAIALLLAAIITTIAVPYVKSKTTVTQQEEINTWVRVAVLSAEMIFEGQGRGEDKKQYVIQFLAQHGVKLDDVRINALIEAAVFELKNGIIKTGGTQNE